MPIPGQIRSWLLFAPLVPSLAVTTFNLYHLLRSRVLRYALNNHTIIALLFCGWIMELTDVFWYFYYLNTGTALSRSPSFCTAWVFIGSSILVVIYLTMAWASIERHILIFHSTWFVTRINRALFHYLPLVICIAWPLLFYGLMFVIVPCSAPFVYTLKQCARYACVYQTPWIAIFDSVVHYILPSFLTAIFSVALLVRVLYHKHRARQRIDWRNYKKMASQLFPISLLYIALVFPPMTLYAAYAAGVSLAPVSNYFSDGLFFCYWSVLFTPFATVLSLPELGAKCRRLLPCWRTISTIHPQPPSSTRPNKTGQAAPIAR